MLRAWQCTLGLVVHQHSFHAEVKQTIRWRGELAQSPNRFIMIHRTVKIDILNPIYSSWVQQTEETEDWGGFTRFFSVLNSCAPPRELTRSQTSSCFKQDSSCCCLENKRWSSWSTKARGKHNHSCQWLPVQTHHDNNHSLIQSFRILSL